MTSLTKKQINWLNKCCDSTWTLNPKTGLVDVFSDFDCSDQGRRDFKGVKFGVVDGNFDCDKNRLTSLKGAPLKVGVSFYCSYNALTSLKGAPQEVGMGFYCYSNRLTSLKGAPQSVSGDFWCDNNRLTSLEGAPQKVGGDFYCRSNALTSLEGAPLKVDGYFDCDNNRLTSLEGAPQEVSDGFDCQNNHLTSLEGAPLKVDGGFCCGNNPVSKRTLAKIYDKMKKGDSFMIAAGSLINKMGKKDLKLISKQLSKKGITEDKIEAIKSWCSIRKMI